MIGAIVAVSITICRGSITRRRNFLEETKIANKEI
jgi:hypothetical protein